ncbi:hypothetical protein KBD45_07865 [Candidatus Dojkabacteria bacterium]|nr:hypothetical protein [Candidatus Dojkabacteria bacterium]
MSNELRSSLAIYLTRIDFFRAVINSSKNPNEILEKLASSVMSPDEAEKSAKEAGVPTQEFIQKFVVKVKEEFGQDDLNV